MALPAGQLACRRAARPPGAAGPLVAAEVVAVAPAAAEVGPEDLREGFRVIFDRPAAPPGVVGQVIAGPSLRFDPPLSGEARWLDPHTLAFFPGSPAERGSALQRSTAYQVSLAPGLVLGPGLRAGGWAGRRFVFDRLRVEEVRHAGAREFQPRSPTFTLVASAPLRAESVVEACAFTPRRPGGTGAGRVPARPAPARAGDAGRGDGELEAALASGRALALVPDEPLQPGTPYLLRCGPELRARTGDQGPAAPHELPFATHGPAGIVNLGPRGRDIPADGVKVSVEFATPMDGAEVRGRVGLVADGGPRRPLAVDGNYLGTTFAWTGDLEPGRSYELVVDAGLRDRFGQALPGGRRHRFQVGDASPRLAAETGIYTVERASGRYPLWARNLSWLERRCAVVPAGRLAAVLTGPADHTRWWQAAEQPVAWKKLGLDPRPVPLTPTGPRNRWLDQGFDLGEACAGSPAASGVYLLELGTREERDHRGRPHPRQRRALVNVTDLGLLAKVGGASSLVWVVRLSTGAPVAGAEVEVRDLRGRVRFTGRTGPDGVLPAPGAARLAGAPAARAELPATAEEGEEEGAGDDPSARRVIVTARSGDDVGLLDTSWDDGIQVWSFGVDVDRRGGDSRLRGFLHSDRGLYRPGDTVHLRGLLRRLDRQGTMTVPRLRSVRVAVLDPRGATVEQTDVPLSAFGGFNRDLLLPGEARLGDWRVQASAEGWTVSERFAVEEYRPRSFEVKVQAGQKDLFLGAKLAFEVQASFLHGSPMRGAELGWSLRRRPHLPAFTGWEDYVFRDFVKLYDEGRWWARDEERSFSEPVGDGETRLDTAGRARVEASDAPGPLPSPQDYLFEARVGDGNGQVVAAGAALTGHAADLYLGLHPGDRVQQAGGPFPVQVVAFDHQGRRRAAAVELRLVRRVYQCGPGDGDGHGDDDGWGCRRKVDPQPAYAARLSVAAEGGAAVAQVTVAQPGEYRVEVSGPDGRGGRALSADLIYVVGAEPAAFQGDDGPRMAIIASKNRYRPGETARLVPQAQLGPALALLTLERDGILRYQVQPLAGSGQALEVNVGRELAPNVLASVVLVRGRSGPAHAQRPQLKLGVIDLPVDASDRRLQVRVTPERSDYRPGDLVRARVKVSGPDGRPVRAELAVAAADEGVLQILGYRTPDPLPAFYAPFGLGVDSATTWNRLLRARAPEAEREEDGEGGDGAGEEAGRVRARFMATAYWNPALVTGADGTAELSFPAPDNLTAFRLMAVAADRGDRFGSGDQRFTVSKPLQAVPALPRFLNRGDRAQAAVTLHNNTRQALDVTVTLAATGVDAGAGPLRTVVAVPPGERRGASFPVTAGAAGEAVLTFRAEAGAHQDAVEARLPVQEAIVPGTVLVTEGATRAPGERVQARLPVLGDVLPGRGELELVVDRTGLARLHEGLGYLVEYPYGCLEQTTSRVVPMVALTDLATSGGASGAAGGLDRARLEGFVRAGVAKILRHQHDDGGFGLWVGAEPELHYSAYALWGLELARSAGYAVDLRARQDGINYLKQHLKSAPRPRTTAEATAGEEASRVFAHQVLAELGEGDPAALAALFETRARLPVYGQAHLLQALARVERADLVAVLARELAAGLPGQAGPALVKEPLRLDWYWSSDVRSSALVLQALLESAPAAPAIPRLAQGLLAARQGGRWSSTQENVYALVALARLARARAEGPPARLVVRLAGRERLRQTLAGTAGRSPVLRWTLPRAELERGPGPLELEVEGGALFYSVRLQVERPLGARASDQGLVVRREYLDPDSGRPLTTLKLGQAVKVRLTVASPVRLAHVAVRDHLPAGLEPVLTRFRPTSKPGDAADEGAAGASPGSWRTAWQHQELHDDRALVFADLLAAGESQHEYLARATTAGRFAIPPATAEAMYRPEIQGRSSAGVLVVER